MIFSHELCIEGRHLKMRKTLRCANCVFSPDGQRVKAKGTKKHVASPSRILRHDIKTVEGFVEAFRPTTPGHSPGVGHSIHN